MTIQEATETIEKNPASFPSGLDTSREEVRDFLEYVAVESVAEKFGQDASTLVAVAQNISCKAEDEVVAACNAAEVSLAVLRNACFKALVALRR